MTLLAVVLIMNLKDYPQISERRKEMMLAMSDSELLIEIEKGKDSILPRSIPFMKAILEERKNSKQENLIEAEQKHQEAILQEAKLANSHSKEANETSGKAYRLSILAIIISIAAIVISMN